jgi:nucleoid-associated protein YgaU
VGLFDKMFGSEVKAALANPDAQQRFAELKQKYQSVLNVIQQENVQLGNLHVQADKLFIRGTAPSEALKNKIWDEIKLVNPQCDDIVADLTVQPQVAHAAAAGAQSQAGAGPKRESGQDLAYMVQPGDSLSRIAERFYGSAHEYMKIYYANKDQITNPDQIRAGMKLNIPEKNE